MEVNGGSRMYMFVSVLEEVPKSRSQLVNELELPDVTVSPYSWSPEESLRSDSLASLSARASSRSDSSLALSRAMTDSEIDYERYHRLKSRRVSDPWWVQLHAALEAFPPEYLDFLNSYQDTLSEATTYSEASERALREDRRRHSEELRLKMERFFEEECCVFAPDDPGLVELQEALQDIDTESIV